MFEVGAKMQIGPIMQIVIKLILIEKAKIMIKMPTIMPIDLAKNAIPVDNPVYTISESAVKRLRISPVFLLS